MSGKFCWWDLNSKEADKAVKFYTELFGWSITPWKPEGAPADMPEYKMIGVGDKMFGGINSIPADAPAPSHWMGHIHVPDLDAAMKRAEGMKAVFPMGAMAVPTVGRMAMFMDPEQAAASLFQPEGELSELPSMDTPGMVGWNELLTADPEKAKAFYSEVVGWKWRKGPMTEMEYHLYGTGEEGGDFGGMMKRPEQMPVSAWFLYFTTKDVDASVAKLKELGGSVMVDPFDVPGVGKLAAPCTAPDGSMFCLAQWAMG